MRLLIVTVLLCAATALLQFSCGGQPPPQPNLVFNSEMLANEKVGNLVDGWSLTRSMPEVRWRNASPLKKGRSALFSNPGTVRDGKGDIRMFAGLFLEPGEQYRFKVWVRTKDFHCGNTGFVAFGPGWNGSFGIQGFPENSDWHLVDEVHTASKDYGKLFSFTLYAEGYSGEIEFAAPQIYPESPAARANVYSVREEALNLIPVTPRTDQIREGEDAALFCRWFADAGMTHDGAVRYSIDGQAERIAPIAGDGMVKLDLGGVGVGTHQLAMQTGNYRRTLPINIIEKLPPMAAARRLNNFHHVIFESEMTANDTAHFVNPRNGMVLFRLPAGARAGLKAPQADFRDGEFIFLPAGEYEFQLTGSAGAVCIGAVSETMLYPVANGPLLPGLKPMDQEHCRKYIFPNYALYVGRGDYLSAEELQSILRSRHHRMFESLSAKTFYENPLDREAVSKFLLNRSAYHGNPSLSPGIIVDEIENNIALSRQRGADLAAIFPDLSNRNFYIWICGLVVLNNAHTANYLQQTGLSAENVRHVFEIYLPSRMTKTDAVAEIERRFEYLKNLRNMSPETYGVNLSYASLPYRITYDLHPGVNYKYYMDLQFFRLANDPDFDGIPLVGYWGDHYADREIARFAGELVRHYVINGKTELFSEQFGYSYAPGHLKNPDFEQGMAHWACRGNIRRESVFLFGRDVQRRSDGGREGDSFAVLKRGSQPNELKQQAKNLRPGELYSLTCLSGNLASLRGTNHDAISLSCRIEGGEIIPELSEHGKPENGRFDKLVFRAQRSDPWIVFSDETHSEGTEAYLNFVSLMPFFSGK